MLGRMYGTSPPPGYYERRSTPGAFEFARGIRPGAPPFQQAGSTLTRARAVLGAREFPVVGTFEVPVVMIAFADRADALGLGARTVQDHFFDGPNPTGTITAFYRRASRGLAELRGAVHGWATSGLTRDQVAGGSSALGPDSRVGEFIVHAAAALDSTGIDWGRFDNDGPDGVPNSGDDDGFVDIFAVLHPTVGAECGAGRASGRVWSHRWSVQAYLGGPYRTASPSASGGMIRVDDYVIQPAVSCSGTEINQIGVFAHELGHGFGLPDLYAVGGAHAAVGQWDLMGTGSWGCPGIFDPARPCPLGAWTRSMLGWAPIADLAREVDHGTQQLDHTLGLGPVLRVPSADPNEYYLIENRGPLAGSAEPVVMVWAVHAPRVSATWPVNALNSDPQSQAVRVVQADGLDHLSRPGGGRGDHGDAFPGTTNARAFHAGTVPGSVSESGVAAGVTLTGLRGSGSTVAFELSTKTYIWTVRPVGIPMDADWLRVDGAAPRAGVVQVRSAPFERHTLEAEPGAPMGAGTRTRWQTWGDGAPRERSALTGRNDSTLVALFDGTQVLLDERLLSAADPVVPGRLEVEPASTDGWYDLGTMVRIRAVPEPGFSFKQWVGTWAGRPNPFDLNMTLPRRVEAEFDVVFDAQVPDVVRLVGGELAEHRFSTDPAALPVQWTVATGTLPAGLSLEGAGILRGIPVEAGAFAVTVRAQDTRGLTADATLTVQVDPPAVSADDVARAVMTDGSGLTDGQVQWFDHGGNRNGRLDLGDLRALLLGGAP